MVVNDIVQNPFRGEDVIRTSPVQAISQEFGEADAGRIVSTDVCPIQYLSVCVCVFVWLCVLPKSKTLLHLRHRCSCSHAQVVGIVE